jgi:hypothetical protein
VGSVAKFASEAKCIHFVSAERAFGEMLPVWAKPKIKLRNRTVFFLVFNSFRSSPQF